MATQNTLHEKQVGIYSIRWPAPAVYYNETNSILLDVQYERYFDKNLV